ncbi:hypothetical protein FBD94_21225 [Pedobacter hiemivivus]|uniref:Uncharacterized protein n=2 Tax=Pedobacter hiemivivus TaxID=2530454 RepID=A0A4U1G188_9SPHI|nr:hypothetical protein FBD94_21225 [Pedobacter hiemivivus]
MMLSNVISLGGELHKETTDGRELDMRGKLGARFMNIFSADVEAGRKTTGSDSQKVLETFEVKTTKSVILNEVIEKAKKVTLLSSLNEGELLRIDNVNLTLENETELRTVKLFTNGSFKGMAIPGANGLDINNVFNSMFKDYAYKIKGNVSDSEEELIVKIPLTFESEFESSYSVDDLFIGKVSLVGLYKGKIKTDALRNSFEFFQEIGSMQNSLNAPDPEIQESQYPQVQANHTFRNVDDTKEYHYIDLLAIVQNVQIPVIES